MTTLLLGAVLVGTLAPLSAQRPAFTSRIDLVDLGVSVADAEGRPVTDLTLDDLEVFEDGVRQDVRYLARGLGADVDTYPMHLGVMLDASESMGADERFAKTAAIRFLSRMTYAEDLTLVDFDDEVRVGLYQQADFLRLVERIRRRRSGGMTAFYDALGVYLAGAFEQDGRKVLLVYSDGEDTRSRMSFRETVDLLRASEVTVYAIGFQQELRQSARLAQRRRLTELAELTGGRAFFPSTAEGLDAIYDDIAEELETRYAIGYVSTNGRADGTWRDVEIRISERRADRDALRIRARAGYYAPYIETEARRP